MFARSLITLASLGFLAACSSGVQSVENGLPSAAQSAMAAPSTGNPASKYIKHVVVIIQENRSFENFFAGFPGANAPMLGYSQKLGHKRVRVRLHQTTFETNSNLPHYWQAAITGYHKGAMDGFHRGPHGNYAAYAYVERSQVAPYWAMAEQYVLADAMFPTEFGGSYTAHLTAVAGTDNISPSGRSSQLPDPHTQRLRLAARYEELDGELTPEGGSRKRAVPVFHAVQHDGASARRR